VVTCYLDESGTDDLSPTAVVGGVIMNEPQFVSFDKVWSLLLSKHDVPFVHMNEFGKHGKLGHLTIEQRRALFADLVPAINDHKLFSVVSTLTTAEYDNHLSSLFDRKTMGVYGTCFILCAVSIHKLAEQQKHSDKIAYLLDGGNSYRHHVLEAHKTMRDWEHFLHVGSIGFGDDEEIMALQSADMISWSARRKITGHFPAGFEQLADLVPVSDGTHPHLQTSFSDELLALLAEALKDLTGGTIKQ
jgi:hypothetical protein